MCRRLYFCWGYALITQQDHSSAIWDCAFHLVHPHGGKEKAMNILVFGAGVIGTIYAWQLSEAGQNVALLVRRGEKAGDRRRGHLSAGKRLLSAQRSDPRSTRGRGCVSRARHPSAAALQYSSALPADVAHRPGDKEGVPARRNEAGV